MTHDFATVPRYVEPLGVVHNKSTNREQELNATSFSVNSPFQLRWILVAALCLTLWFFLSPDSHKPIDVIPGQGEVVEFQQDMEAAYLVGNVKDARQNVEANSIVNFTAPAEFSEPKTAHRGSLPINKGREARGAEGKAVAIANTISEDVIEDIGEVAEYGFYDNLRNSQWAVQTQRGAYVSRELTARKKAKYKLQAASFRGADDANRLVKKLSKFGLKARSSVSISTNGAEWFQVSVGPFSNVSKMNKAQDILVSLNMMPLKKKI